MGPQFSHLCQQANSIADTFAAGHLPHNTAWLSLTTMLWPSLHYSLRVTSFSETQSLQITQKLYLGLLPKLGIACSFPLSLCHAPNSLFGLGLPSILWEQGIAALWLLLKCGNGPLVAGSLFLTSVEQAQLEVGSITPFYQLPFQQYGFLLTNCWLKSLWNFLASAGLHLQSSNGSGLHLQCKQDVCLMDSLVSLAAFTPASLQAFNQCHLYMQSLTLADLSTGDGCHLHAPFVTHFSPWPSSPFLWPLEWLLASDWALWQSILSQVLCSSGYLLLSPLGCWTRPPHCMGSFMPYNPTLDILYIPGQAGVWHSYHCSPFLLATHLRVGCGPASVSPFSPTFCLPLDVGGPYWLGSSIWIWVSPCYPHSSHTKGPVPDP